MTLSLRVQWGDATLLPRLFRCEALKSKLLLANKLVRLETERTTLAKNFMFGPHRLLDEHGSGLVQDVFD